MKTKKIGVINYGYGNIFSVVNALKYLNLEYKIINESKQIFEYKNIILPGVGSFGNVMNKLNELKFSDAIKNYVEDEDNLLLGICVGMQVFFNESEESINTPGLGLIGGKVKKLTKKSDSYIDRIPNIGWRENFTDIDNLFFEKNLNEKKTYFIHSYHCIPEKKYKNISYINRGSNEKIVSSIFEKNIIGIQFHAERSKDNGLELIKEIFLNWRNYY